MSPGAHHRRGKIFCRARHVLYRRPPVRPSVTDRLANRMMARKQTVESFILVRCWF